MDGGTVEEVYVCGSESLTGDDDILQNKKKLNSTR